MMSPAARRADLRDLSLELLDPNPGNPRFDVGDVTDLAASIEEQGLLEPIIVAGAVDERHVIIAGHRRAEACRKIGLEFVPAIVRADLDTRTKQIQAMLVENLQRADLTPIEEAAAYQQLTLEGLDVTAIATAVGRSNATITKRLKLMTLGQRTREKIHDRKLTLELAEQLTEFNDDPKTLRALEKSAGTYDFDWKLKQARKARKDAADQTRLIAKLEKQGIPIVERPTGKSRIAELWALPSRPAPSKHAKCPGHAAYIQAAYNGVEAHYVCTQPKLHPAPKTKAGASTTTKRRYDPKYVDASEQRLTHVRGILKHGIPDLTPILQILVMERIERAHSDPPALGAALELLGVEPGKKDARARKELLRETLALCKEPAAIARVWFALEAGSHELGDYETLRQSHRWDSYSPQAPTWVGLLERYGYKRGPLETKLLAKHTPKGGDR